MSSAFSWQGQPSKTARKPKRKSRAAPMDAQQRTERVLRMRHISAYLHAQRSQKEES